MSECCQHDYGPHKIFKKKCAVFFLHVSSIVGILYIFCTKKCVYIENHRLYNRIESRQAI